MKLKDIKLKTCPFCDGEGVLIHSKPDDGYIYSEGVHAFVKCKECDACGPMPDVEYNHAASGYPGRMKAISKAIELAVKGWNRRDGRKANGPKVSLLRPIHFNSLQDEEFCYYGRKKRRGYIAPYDKESV